MKKIILLVLFVTVVVLAGCMTSEQENDAAYELIFANINDSSAIQSYLEKEEAKGNDIDVRIKNGDTILMIAARYTTDIEVLKVIASYYPSIHKLNNKTDMSAIDYLSRREGTEEMKKFLIEESIKQELRDKANETKNNIVKSLFNNF